MAKKRTAGLRARPSTKTSTMEQELRDLGLAPANSETSESPTPILDAIEQALLGEVCPVDPDKTQDLQPIEAAREDEPLDSDQQALNDAVVNLDQAAAEAPLDAEDGMSDAEILARLEGKTPEEAALILGLSPDEVPVIEATASAPEETASAPEETASAPEETASAPEETASAPEETVLSAEEASALFAEGGIEALAGRSFHPFTTEDGTQVDDGVTGVPATAIPALAPIKRTSRIAPLAAKVVATLREGKKSVPDMAKMFNVSERDIRLAIDKARAQGEKIERLAPKVFGYPERAPARRRLTATPIARSKRVVAPSVPFEPAH